jgi:hypothetical protein
MAKAPYIEDHRLKHMLKVAAVSGEFPVRNVAMLTTIYGTGMMLTEIARLPLKAYLHPDGSTLDESAVAPEIAYNGTQRPLYWSNEKVTAAIDKYLLYRVEHRHRVTTRKAAYCGLDPERTSPTLRHHSLCFVPQSIHWFCQPNGATADKHWPQHCRSKAEWLTWGFSSCDLGLKAIVFGI